MKDDVGDKGEKVEKDPSVEQKITNTSTLILVEDCEFILNKFLEEFHYIESLFPNEFVEVSKKIKTEKRKQNQEEWKKKEQKRLKEIQQQRQEEKNKRQVKKIGKPAMRRIEAPRIKKEEVKKVVQTEEQKDMMNYLGL